MSTLDFATPYGDIANSRRHGNVRQTEFGMRGRVIIGTIFAILLVAGIGGWSVTAKLSGAIIASGTVLVEENVQVIQHPDGGVISAIEITEGADVTAGQTLLRLDDLHIRTELSILNGELGELLAREARLIAERDGGEVIAFPKNYLEQYPNAAASARGEEQLFSSTRRNQQSQREQLELQVSQLRQEIVGLEAQRGALDDELQLMEDERQRIQTLSDQGLIETTRLNAADRELARTTGSLGELDASIARSLARISEIQLQVLSIDDIAYTEAQRELRSVEARVAELNDRLVEVQNRLSRTVIRAPVTGTVNELSVTTLGGVITPAERLVTIVPSDANLRIEFKIAANDVDQIEIGQAVKLRFSAFNQRTTPEIDGIVSLVSPATVTDAETGQSYYLAAAQVVGDLDTLGPTGLMPGMPVEVFVQTDEQIAIAYFAKPFTDQIARAFREE